MEVVVDVCRRSRLTLEYQVKVVLKIYQIFGVIVDESRLESF